MTESTGKLDIGDILAIISCQEKMDHTLPKVQSPQHRFFC